MSDRNSTLSNRLAELTAAIASAEKMPLFDQAKEVHRLVRMSLALSAELVQQVELLQAIAVANSKNARDRV